MKVTESSPTGRTWTAEGPQIQNIPIHTPEGQLLKKLIRSQAKHPEFNIQGCTTGRFKS